MSNLATTERTIVGAGWFPAWSADGSRLFFSSYEGLGLVDVASLDPFESGDFRTVPIRLGGDNTLGNVAGTDDGRILVARPAGTDIDQTDTVAVIVNWFDELRRRAPAGR